MKYFKLFGFGVLIWIILFGIGMIIWPLHESNLMLFKSLMVVSAALFGMLFIILYFRKINTSYLKEGIILGIAWFLINIILDLVILVMLLKQDLSTYIADVGIRYLNIIIMCMGAGLLLKLNSNKT